MRWLTTDANANPNTSITTAETISTVPTKRTCNEVRHASVIRSLLRFSTANRSATSHSYFTDL